MTVLIVAAIALIALDTLTHRTMEADQVARLAEQLARKSG